MKNIQLENKHLELGAKMAPFAGYTMPIQYEGVKSEHLHVRNKVGLFDVSHMGEFFVSGPGALNFLQKVTTNDVAKLFPGKVQYTCMPNDQGGIVDDLLVYMLAEEEYMLVVNAANIDKDFQWLDQHREDPVKLINESDQWSLLAVQGPASEQLLQELTELDIEGMKFYTFERATFAGCEDVIVSATGYTGEKGCELYIRNADAAQVWKELFRIGEAYDLRPIGLGARDTLRMEKGLCLYGNDIDSSTSPIEARLGWITKFTKDFISAAQFKKQKEEGTAQKLVGLIMEDRGIPRKDYLIQNEEGETIGRVTSGTQSPSLGEAIGLGYVDVAYKEPGTVIYIAVRKKQLRARVTKLPFV